MRNHRKNWALMTFCIVPMTINVTYAESTQAGNDHDGVMVFSARHLPAITSPQSADRVFYLDGAGPTLAGLRFTNPGNQELAVARATAMLQTRKGQEAIEQITQVGEGIALAWQHGIERLPAVMVGGTHVVYGVFDVSVALLLVAEAQGRAQ